VKLSSEEAQAILDEMRPAVREAARESVVATRDFREPRRLGPEHLGDLRKSLRRALPALERTLETWLGRPIELELADLGETEARAIFEPAAAPPCALSFRVQQAQEAGWIVWDACAAAAELALGSAPAPDAGPRTLSPVERGLIEEVLAGVADGLAGALAQKRVQARLLQGEEGLEALREEAATGDPQRIGVHISVRGLGESESTLHAYLAGVARPQRAAAPGGAAATRALPEHLGVVPVALSAELGSLDLPLSALLALEVGDVIALGVEVGSALQVRVEDRRCARAAWGRSEGKLVLRIQDMAGDVDEDK
jgi:flagellar motor switch protein FliM